MSRGEILAIIQGSPIAGRTAGIVTNVLSRAVGLAKVLVVTPGPWRGPVPEGWEGSVALVPREDRWADQILKVARESGCRWLVAPSYMDRYLPGVFETVEATGGASDHAVIGPCLVKTGAAPAKVGPDPFTFDFFRLMFGQNYIAPGAVFLSAAQFVANGGFHRRFPTAAVLEYLLRCGAGGSVLSVSKPFLETDALPFLGIPPEYAGRYAIEAALVAQEASCIPFTPGTAAGVAAALRDAIRHPDHAFAFGAGSGDLGYHWRDLGHRMIREDLGLPSATPLAAIKEKESAPTRWQLFKWAVRGRTPRPVWNALKRTKRAYQGFTAPLP